MPDSLKGFGSSQVHIEKAHLDARDPRPLIPNPTCVQGTRLSFRPELEFSNQSAPVKTSSMVTKTQRLLNVVMVTSTQGQIRT